MLFKIYDDRKEELLLAIANCGFITEQQAIENISISKETLNKLVKTNDLIKEIGVMIYSSPTTIYRLTEKTKYYVKVRFIKRLYRSDNLQINHDYCMSKVYYSISDQERKTWLTESDLKSIHKGETTCDAIYINDDNKMVGIEVITKSYDKKMKDEKLKFIYKFCDYSIVLHD